MPPKTKIRGDCGPKFFRVKKVFEELFEEDKELRAGVAVTIDGRLVVNLWGGYADPDRTRTWERDTLVNVYSTTKGMTATCVHRLVDQGLLDLDQKVSHYWPEFGCNGKEEICVRHLLCHQAGLPAIDKRLPPEAIFDWDTMTRAIAEQALLWQPGTKHGYHARTYGWLLGEIVRRITGKSLGTYFHDEIAGPLGLDFYIGLQDEHHGRVAYITAVPEARVGFGYVMNLTGSSILTQIWAPGKHPMIVKARSLLCYWAVRQLRFSAAELSKRLRISQPSVSISVERGETIAKAERLNLFEG